MDFCFHTLQQTYLDTCQVSRSQVVYSGRNWSVKMLQSMSFCVIPESNQVKGFVALCHSKQISLFLKHVIKSSTGCVNHTLQNHWGSFMVKLWNNEIRIKIFISPVLKKKTLISRWTISNVLFEEGDDWNVCLFVFFTSCHCCTVWLDSFLGTWI